jgi:hypothetical protein
VQNNAVTSIFMTFAVMILALYVSIDIFASGKNALGQFYFYILIGSFLFGFFSHRKAFYFLLMQTAYLDYFKRLMVLDSGVSQMDLYWVLGISPATFSGIVLALLFQLGKASKLRPLEGRIIVITLIFMALSAVIVAGGSGGGFRALGNAVNGIIYMAALFVVPRIFAKPGDLHRCMKFIIYLYIPSACYLIYQSYFDLTWWEHLYLQKGLSIEVRQYNEKVFRCFGTMAGASTATVVYSFLSAQLIHGGLWRYHADGTPRSSAPFLRGLLAVFFAFAAWRTFSRTGWVLGGACLFAYLCLPKRSMVAALYASFALTLVTIIAAAPYLLKHQVLNEIDIANKKTMSEEAGQSTQLATLNGRLEGLYSLVTKSQYWTPFGPKLAGIDVNKVRGTVYSHDFLTDILMYYGFVPLLLGLYLVYRVLRLLHHVIFTLPSCLERELAVLGVGTTLGIALGGMSSGAIFSVFPQNLFVYFYLGATLSIFLINKEKSIADKMLRADAAEEEEALAREERLGRFQRPTPNRRRLQSLPN